MSGETTEYVKRREALYKCSLCGARFVQGDYHPESTVYVCSVHGKYVIEWGDEDSQSTPAEDGVWHSCPNGAIGVAIFIGLSEPRTVPIQQSGPVADDGQVDIDEVFDRR